MAPSTVQPSTVQPTTSDYDVVVIGSGFGGSMAALTIAHKLKEQSPRVHVLERGTWWTTPVSTVQDKTVRTYAFLKEKGQPVQYWSSVEHLKGFIDIVLRCVRRPKNEDGLYDVTQPGRRGPLGLSRENDGVSILRASGVGGGSLIYSNITIRPPDFVLEDPRWPLTWTSEERNYYFHLARHAIGWGVISALNEAAKRNIPYKSESSARPDDVINMGLANIVTRSARLNPKWEVIKDPRTGQEVKRITIDGSPGAEPADRQNRYWVDRARVFQTAMRELTPDFGTVDSSINDVTPEGTPLDPWHAHNYPAGTPINYCERQGRCNVGCLPGARHTLNKQLMRAMFGSPDGKHKPDCPNLSLEALAEVDFIRALPEGGYEVHYFLREHQPPHRKSAKVVRARRVVLAAGCLGTNEILLRSRARGGLPHLSPRLGFGFSTNGDYIAFLEDIQDRVSLTRGPVTTSFGHFNNPEAEPGANAAAFHIVEDQGIPRALASTIGFGVPLLRSFAKGRDKWPRLLVIWTIVLWAWHRLTAYVRAFFLNYRERQDEFKSEDEFTYQMMCVVASGREASVGQFTLGERAGETPLRVKRTDGLPFHKDPIYVEIGKSLSRLAKQLKSSKDFINPFLTAPAGALTGKTIALTHPLGGCRMAKTVEEGVADEFGRVFDASRGGDRGFYDGLYVADAAVIPTALAANPSLTISALALRIADKIVDEMAGATAEPASPAS